MIYINKTGVTTLVLNVNNNTRDSFTTYLLKFTHILSNNVKQYTVNTNIPQQYSENNRYCEMVFVGNFTYEGEYKLEIYGNSSVLVYTGIIIVGEQTDEFTTYISDNENNTNYIYVE